MKFNQPLDEVKRKLEMLPKKWDGRECVLELKEADYNWRQMEWWAFYFEYKCYLLLQDVCEFPGDRINNVSFDMKYHINFDIKAKAIKSDEHKVILNDTEAMDIAVKQHGSHGEIIALCDVEYNDEDRTFQKWHTELKGGLSAYEKDRIQRTSSSRYRKVKADLCEVLIVILAEKDMVNLDVYKQGRNSNGKPRPPKYMINLESLDMYDHTIIKY